MELWVCTTQLSGFLLNVAVPASGTLLTISYPTPRAAVCLHIQALNIVWKENVYVDMFWGLAVKDQTKPDRYIQNDSECGLRPFPSGLMLETLPVG